MPSSNDYSIEEYKQSFQQQQRFETTPNSLLSIGMCVCDNCGKISSYDYRVCNNCQEQILIVKE